MSGRTSVGFAHLGDVTTTTEWDHDTMETAPLLRPALRRLADGAERGFARRSRSSEPGELPVRT